MSGFRKSLEAVASPPRPSLGHLPDERDHHSRIVEELADRETKTCQDYGLEKPGLPIIRAAVEARRREGQSMESIADDLDLVTAKIIAIKPELERIG